MSLDRASEVDKFDRYAQSYDQAHAASVRASGEAPEYFARHKLECLLRLGAVRAHRVLDYGCGTGSLTRLLTQQFQTVSGYDPSLRSLQEARNVAPSARYHQAECDIPDAAFDVAILSGVLHHVPPLERSKVLESVVRKLCVGGRMFVFEHNPYNPLTVRAVRACEFDDDAILLTPGELRGLLQGARLGALRQDYVLFFIRALRSLRPFEPLLRWCPFGAQTLTLGTRVV